MNAPTRPLNAKVWERDPFDFYVEERRASRALFVAERFIGDIWDPACGRGHIVEEAIAAGHRAFGSDVVDRSSGHRWFEGEFDFLVDDAALDAPNIVSNPPFFRAKGAEAFIRRALAIALAKVAIFAEIGFLAGDKRGQGLFAELPPSRIYSISPRINCPPGAYIETGGKPEKDTSNWIWMVWDLTAPRTATTFHWLRAPKEGAA